MVMVPQIRKCDILAEVNAAVEAEVGVGGNLVKGGRDRFDLLMIRGHAVAHKTVGRRQAVEHVNCDHQTLAFEEMVGRVKSCRPGPNDRHPQRQSISPWLSHQLPPLSGWF